MRQNGKLGKSVKKAGKPIFTRNLGGNRFYCNIPAHLSQHAKLTKYRLPIRAQSAELDDQLDIIAGLYTHGSDVKNRRICIVYAYIIFIGLL